MRGLVVFGAVGQEPGRDLAGDQARPFAVGLCAAIAADVVRGAGAPDNVALSNNGRGDRVATLTYSRGDRAGIYTFTAGRLTMVERGPEAAPQPRTARPKAAKKRAAT